MYDAYERAVYISSYLTVNYLFIVKKMYDVEELRRQFVCAYAECLYYLMLVLPYQQCPECTVCRTEGCTKHNLLPPAPDSFPHYWCLRATKEEKMQHLLPIACQRVNEICVMREWLKRVGVIDGVPSACCLLQFASDLLHSMENKDSFLCKEIELCLRAQYF